MDRLSQAARPTLFDAAAQPELLIALMFADLMSPSLWELKRRIHERASTAPQDTGSPLADPVMSEIHDYVNRKFHHVSPIDVAAIWGLLDLEEERARLGAGVVDHALDIILRGLEERRQRGLLTTKQDLFMLADLGKFPEYEYSTIDVVEAHSLNMDKKHRPLGVSSCADEAAIIAALACAAGGARLDEIAILGSPIHYTTFVAREGERFWFNGKQEYYDAQAWRNVVQDGGGEQIQRAFDARIGVLDRAITPSGFHLLQSNECTMASEHARRVYGSFAEFLGAEPTQIAQARRDGIEPKGGCPSDIPLIDVAEAGDAPQVEEMVRRMAEQHPGSVYELALYTFRCIHVGRPEAYVKAALRGYRARIKAAEVRNVAHAVEMVKRVPGTESIFGTTDRIALPDEVLLFHTGSHRDKALFLYSLIHLSPQIAEEQKRGLEMIFTDDASYVGVDGRCVNTRTFVEESGISNVVLKVRGADG